MTYQVLARKWRPQVFDAVVGQDPVTRTLRNALASGRVAHAYLFTGPRGVGKTTTARLLAKALACTARTGTEACGACPSCQDFASGAPVDVMEIDAASNTSVDDIRTLRENVKYAPARGRFKVYIVDEVHMLSGAAFNAFLKTLEEPPAHVVFILATTDPKKIPATVLSRCQRFDFRPIPPELLTASLTRILEQERVPFEAGALPILVRAAEGSLRDALSLLDTAIAYGEGRLDEGGVARLLGSSSPVHVRSFVGALLARDGAAALEAVDRAATAGEDLGALCREAVEMTRRLLVTKVAPAAPFGDLTPAEAAELQAAAEPVSADELIYVLRAFLDADAEMRRSPHPRVELEIAAVRATRRPQPQAIETLIGKLEEAEPTVSQATTPIAVTALMAWAVANDVERARAEQTMALAARIAAAGTSYTLAQFRSAALSMVTATKDANYAFEQRLQIEPVGMLHLERLSFIPAGIERGELKYSVPLAPGETVNITHKEWSHTSEEFERIVTDSIEAFSEEGVTEKSELTQSTTNQQQHSSGFDLGVTASGGWGPVSISTTANYNVSDSASVSQQTARSQSNELTRKASSRSKKEHKMSFKVASASGTEDQAVRLIKNPFPDRPTRVDYHQLVRKWRVDLYRHGLRMTYDLTIPEPGSDVLSKLVELKAVTAALQEGFGESGASLPWARFDITPQHITRGNYLALAAQYGVTVEPPPTDEVPVTRAFTRNWPNKDASNDSDYTTFEVEAPEGYTVRGWRSDWRWWAWTDEDFHFEIRPDLNTWLGVGGALTLSVGTKWVSAFDIQLKLWFGLTPAAFDAWRQRAWGSLREAAQARYEQNRTMLKDRLAQLQEELSAQDALSLRKIEREEVMKHVLRWLFGPSFTFVPPGLPPNLYGPGGAVLDDTLWALVLAHGEVIKFLHQAIEWENMLFFLYPYFWSHPARWEFKKYLDHPDFLHRVFLKSGSARVVLTIRPGFERDFVSFLKTGRLDGLPQGHPYMTIATEMQAFANTNYPGIRSANPVDNARPLLTPLQQKAWDQMQGIIGLLERFRETSGAYPTTAQGLDALAPLGPVPPADPWGRAYQYRSPGSYTDFELFSLGADGQPAGEGEDGDITSWAEASLIGQWYEYTPTSALDIAFDETMPPA